VRYPGNWAGGQRWMYFETIADAEADAPSPGGDKALGCARA
jgi:hypothetical protein